MFFETTGLRIILLSTILLNSTGFRVMERKWLQLLHLNFYSMNTDRPTPSTLGEAIRMFRKRRLMTQAQLAEAATMTQGFISLVEKNAKQPTLEALESIANALEVPSYLLLYLAQRQEKKQAAAQDPRYQGFYDTMFENLDVLSDIYVYFSSPPMKAHPRIKSRKEQLEQELRQKTKELRAIKEQLRKYVADPNTIPQEKVS